jgi:hypothetical protein
MAQIGKQNINYPNSVFIGIFWLLISLSKATLGQGVYNGEP